MVSLAFLPDVYEGRHVARISVESGDYSISVLSLGAILEDVVVPDKDGKKQSVVLKMPKVLDNITSPHYGQVIGRFANRIARGTFSLNGKTYRMETNDHGVNALHCGSANWGVHMWEILPFDPDGSSVSLCYSAPDGEDGLPGHMTATITYEMTVDGDLTLTYTCLSDQDTICNPTNHTYFNLSGSGNVEGHVLQMSAPSYLEVDDALIPSGKILPTAGTPFDFSSPKPLGQDWGKTPIDGYDHCFILGPECSWLHPFGRIWNPANGIAMEMRTNLPAVQVYTGNGLSGEPSQNGAQRHGAVCFETEFYPDAPNHENFPPCVLKAGEVQTYLTGYKFSVR